MCFKLWLNKYGVKIGKFELTKKNVNDFERLFSA